MLDLPLVLPRANTPEAVYDRAILPLVQASAPKMDADALALIMVTPQDRILRAASRLSLRVAEHAADQARDTELRAVLDALIKCVSATNDLLHGLDHDDALTQAEAAAEALRGATEDLIEAWGLEG